MRRLPALAALFLALWSSCDGAAHPDTPPPNVVFVLADDLGYGDLSSFGSATIRTPHIDSVAAEGTRFTALYATAAVCTPSRFGLLTGRYSGRADLGLAGFPVYFPHHDTGMPAAETTLAELLKDRGYATALIGKWHLGHRPDFLPTQQGFDLFLGLPYSNDMGAATSELFPPLPIYENASVIEESPDQRYLLARFTDRAVSFIEHNAAQQTPFFLYFPSHAPHVPLHPHPDFAGSSAGGAYGDVVEELDFRLGQLLEALDRLGVADNTLVVFTSDNGPWLSQGAHGGSAGLLREGKGTTFEGGYRVPTVARLPGRIEPGTNIDAPAVMFDWLPTIARLSGADTAGIALDGVDLMAVLGGDNDRRSADPFRFLYYRVDHQTLGAYRQGRFKLKFPVDGGESYDTSYSHPEVLFDLETDPGETTDIAAAHPVVVEELRAEMRKLASNLELPHP